MAVIDTILTFGFGWLLSKSMGGKGGASTPSKVPWPGAKPGGGGAATGYQWPTQDLAERAADEQQRHDALQARLDSEAQGAVDKAKAKNDKEALRDIAEHKHEKQKALDDMQADIARANQTANPSLLDRVQSYFAGTNPLVAGPVRRTSVLFHPQPYPRKR